MKNKILAFVCILAISISVILPGSQVKAEEKSGTGLGFYVEVEASPALDAYRLSNYFGPVGALGDASYFARFSDTYFYNNMNSSQRFFYDKLKAASETMLFTSVSAQSQQYTEVSDANETFPVSTTKTANVMPGIPYSGLSQQEALEVFIIFSNANPHYYFLGPGLMFANNGLCYPIIYDTYANGVTRSEYTNRLIQKIESWLLEVNEGASILEKQRNIYNVLARDLSYASGVWDPHQSIATAVFTGKTVCAGYSECMALLAKACGMEALVITSSDHEWVQIRHGDYWYNSDLTFDDNGTYPSYNLFNVSDATISKDGMHDASVIYKQLKMPECPFDFGQEFPVASTAIPMWRLYEPRTGEHLYTGDERERRKCLEDGWLYEDVAWKAPKYSQKPVYRIFNPDTGEHHYTADSNEVRKRTTEENWINEGIKWYSDEDSKGMVVYRLYNPRGNGIDSHHYTSNLNERNKLIHIDGYMDEGVAWYGL